MGAGVDDDDVCCWVVVVVDLGVFVVVDVVILGVVDVVVVDVVVVIFFKHWQSQSAMPAAVAKENDELSPSRSAKKPLSCPNFKGFAAFAENCESLMTFIKAALSTSIATTLDPTVASS